MKCVIDWRNRWQQKAALPLLFFIATIVAASFSMASQPLAEDGVIEAGQLLEGVAVIEDVNTSSNDILIDEYRYAITPETKFYSQPGELISKDIFIEGQLVHFIAEENGELISLREEIDFEGEFTGQREVAADEDKAQDQTIQSYPKSSQQNDGVYFEDGVWKN